MADQIEYRQLRSGLFLSQRFIDTGDGNNAEVVASLLYGTPPGGAATKVPTDAASGGLSVYNQRAIQGESAAFARLLGVSPWAYFYLSGTPASQQIGSTGNRILGGIVVTTKQTAAGTITIYDSTTNSGNILQVQDVGTAAGIFPALGTGGGASGPLAQNGLYCQFSASAAGLVAYVYYL